MAIRVLLRPLDADNIRGSLPAARNDWRSGHADSMSARDNTIPLQMPDIRLQAKPARLFKIDLLCYLREESIHWLDFATGDSTRPYKYYRPQPE
jgi:hypothetical protein